MKKILLSLCVVGSLHGLYEDRLEDYIFSQEARDRMHHAEFALQYTIGTTVAKNFPVQYLNSKVADCEPPPTEWDFFFYSHSALKAPEAADLAARLTKALEDEINKDSKIVRYMNHGKEPTVLLPNIVNVRITFWQDNFDRMKPPYVAEVGLYNGYIHTRFSDPQDHLEKIRPFIPSPS